MRTVGVAEDAAPRRSSGATLLTVVETIATNVPQYRRQLGSFPGQCELLVAPERIQVNTSGQGIDVVVVADLVAIQDANLHRVVRLVKERQANLNDNLNTDQFEIHILNSQDIILGRFILVHALCLWQEILSTDHFPLFSWDARDPWPLFYT